MTMLPEKIPIHSNLIRSRTSPLHGKLRNPHLKLEIDLTVVRRNVEYLAKTAGVPLLPVVKADAYGLGVEAICETIADLAAGFCVFQASEAIDVGLAQRTGKRVLALGPPESLDPADYIFNRITPTVSNPFEARRLRKASPALCIDTGMQRFSCAPQDVPDALASGDCQEAFTHATSIAQLEQFKELTNEYRLFRHAAASSLLHNATATLDAVRPGLALSRNAIRISARIVEVHESCGPAGYSGFVADRHAIILVGYSHGLRKGPCVINGRKTQILEVGMQSAFVNIGAKDRLGDEIILLDEYLTATDLAAFWNCSPHEVLTSLTSSATRSYRY